MKKTKTKMPVRKKAEETMVVFTFRCVCCKHDTKVEDDGAISGLPACEKCGCPTYAMKMTLTKRRL